MKKLILLGTLLNLLSHCPDTCRAEIPYPPTIVRQPPSDILIFKVATEPDEEEKPFILECEATGNPLPKYKWTKNGHDFAFQLYDDRISQQPRRGTLVFMYPRPEDEGYYQCLAINPYGTSVSNSVLVRKLASPYWITAPNNTNAAEEESVHFECKASGEPQPDIQWFMNGIPLSNAKQNPNRKLISPTVLTIDQLTKLDTAVYQCNASNILGYVYKNFYLNVLSMPPEMTESPEALYETFNGDTITLRCRVFGAPKPEVKWFRGGKQLTGGRFVIQPNGDLEIRSALFTDVGVYKCTAINKFGYVESSVELGNMEVRERTKITAKPEDYEVAAGNSATFRCSAMADVNLELEVNWLANGQPIDFDGDPRMYKGTDDTLTISKTSVGDLGTYTCVAKTPLDNVTASAHLYVQDRPNPPRLIGVECNQKTAIIKWLPHGDNRAPILSYIIQYDTSFTPDTWDVAFEAVPASESKFEVSVSPWVNYSFRVLARNKIGDSLPSVHSIQCETPPDVPYKNPDNVQGEGTTPNNLVISWAPMPQTEHNGRGFFYKVYWKRTPTMMEWMTETVGDWNQTNLVVDNQPTFQPFTIKVEAHNSKGQANVAAVEVMGYSGEDYPKEAPQQLKVLEIIDDHTARLQWKPVPQESIRGHLKGYKIQTWSGNHSSLLEVTVPSNTTMTVVNIFAPFSENFVKVLAFNNRYDGPPSEIIRFTTPEGRPGPVASFHAAPKGSRALRLTWKKPTEINGHLLGYKIYYQLVNKTKLGPTIERIIDHPDTTLTRLTGLEPNTKYRLTITANTIAGHGIPRFIEVLTGDAIARAPEKPEIKWVEPLEMREGTAGVLVTWLPNLEGQVGTHFYVQFRRRGETLFLKTKDIVDNDSVEVNGLEPGRVYEIRVVAVNGQHHVESDISRSCDRGKQNLYEKWKHLS